MNTLRCLPMLALLLCACGAGASNYEVLYRVSLLPAEGEARVEIRLKGERLPSRLTLHTDPGRHRDFSSDDPLEISEDTAVWRPKASPASLSYTFSIDHRKGNGAFDAMSTGDWAVLRSDQLVPPIAVKAPKGLQSRAELVLDLPRGWSAAVPYEPLDDNSLRYRLENPGRRFIQPRGWLILGDISSRQDMVDGVHVRIAAPAGQDIRLLDALAIIHWTLPNLKSNFPGFPPRLLVVSAGDPMWRGGLSAPNSLFSHGDRPL
ncbi:MAG: hypothetical protein ACK5HY_02300, partial [Parahaliea sp.]